MRRTRVQRPAGADLTTTLPDDLLNEQFTRVQVFHAVAIAVWSLNLLMDTFVKPQGDRGAVALVVQAAGVAAATIIAAHLRWGPGSRYAKINLGVVMVVAYALGTALINSWPVQPTAVRPVSPITGLVLFFGMLAPARPAKVFVIALLAASMDPLTVGIAHLRGLPAPSPFRALLLFYPNYVAAVLAVAPARILYRLGRQIREARALGSYHLVERLGEGGMGEVWLARHRLLARSAAIKLIRPEMLSDSSRDQAAITLNRFEREAQTTAGLTSPHTIRLFDFGLTDEGTFYYVMELLDGRDLESLVREFGPLPPARVMHFVRQVCRSLAEAHAIGLIHRDIKPANIFVCRMGLEYDFVKVLDFGLVKHEHRADAATLLTGGSLTMGTPAYMAPEVILGDAVVDRRVDVYAVGCVAYFLLTGEQVFEAASPVKLLMQHVQVQPTPPSYRTEQHIPREIDDFVMSCLHKDPDRRPSSAQELMQLASACKTGDVWDERSAKKWWEAHLPQLTIAATIRADQPEARTR